MSRRRSIVLSVLVMCTAYATFAAHATATQIIPCINVGSSGGYSDSRCANFSEGGSYVRGRARNGQISACYYVGENNGVYTGPTCLSTGGTKLFEWFGTASSQYKFNGGTSTLKGTIAGTAAKIVCGKMKANEPVLTSGESAASPGEITATSIEYTECKVEEPKNCEVHSVGKPAGTIDTGAVIDQLVQNTAKTKVESLLFPKEGTVLATIDLAGELCVSAGQVKVTGNFLTSVAPEDEAAGKLEFKSEPEGKEYINSKGETKTAKLELAGKSATLQGLATIEGEVDAAKLKGEVHGGEFELSAGKMLLEAE